MQSHSHHSQNAPSMSKPRTLNIDDMPISAPKAQNFEELLEQQLRNQDLLDDEMNFGSHQRAPAEKKQFLKKKSKNIIAPSA